MAQAAWRRAATGGFGPLAAALAAALPAFLSGCAPVPHSASSAVGASPAVLVERLPAVAAGFRRGAARPIGGAEEGREVSYATPGGRLTAAATVELLAENTAAAAALDAALADALRAGPAREMRDAGRLAVAAGGVSPLLCAETVGRYGRERVAGLVCAGRVGGALLRIRVTMPAREPPPADPRAFAEAIAVALSGPGAVAASAPSG
ncbi:MAG: hypothetical protein AVDCRST_MAG04-3601 [uncultured Acetobacteraceae bacterium]|uniref:Lipoprotein n=1 Tax=uncultured Acetobacteraceae bacterium TaxID=169975 RepID=A0A6J4JGH2_9PROT|nr:MAG: hypothetical protein AVDCRST_MAG04-3601 [uncultured Acetobacteraceae bacterium]